MRLFIVLLLPVESVVKERTAETAGQGKTAIDVVKKSLVKSRNMFLQNN